MACRLDACVWGVSGVIGMKHVMVLALTHGVRHVGLDKDPLARVA